MPRLTRVLVMPALLAVALAAQTRPVWPAQSPAAAQLVPRLDVQSWGLPNGLKVLFLAVHKAPLVTVQVFYHVGSRDENIGGRGIAHMFEHMMFKGSVHVPPEEHARLLKVVGGESNAFTTEDLTAYHDTVPPSYLDFALELEAERMRNLKLFPGTVDSERLVVMEEKRLRVDNSPVGRALELLRQEAFPGHPYGWSPAGKLDDLRKVTPAACQRFYDVHYQPNNATLVVVGDAEESDVRRLVAARFGALSRAAVPDAPDTPQVPLGDGRRDRSLTMDIQVPVIIGGYHIPGVAHPDMAALEVLSAVLAAGDSARMPRRLVEERHLALAAGGVTQTFERAGLFLVYAVHLPDRDQAQVRAALLEEVARARAEDITSAELNQAKNQLAASFIYGLETVDGIASQLGTAATLEGDWRRFPARAQRYMAVSAADVRRVAKLYLADSNLTLVSLNPTRPTAGSAAGQGRP